MTGDINATSLISFFNSSNYRIVPINSAISMQAILDSHFEALARVNEFLSVAVDMRSYGVIQLLLNKYHASPEMANTPDEHGVTLIQRWARNTDLEMVNLFFRVMDKNKILINPQAFFTEEAKEGCGSSSQISEIDRISLEELEDSFVGQKLCNAIVITTSKEKHILQHTHIDRVMDRISDRFGEKPDDSDKMFVLFGNVHFSFGGIDPSDSLPKVLGFCPTGEPVGRPITFTRGSNVGPIHSREISTMFSTQYGQVVDDTPYKIDSDTKNHLRIPIRMHNKTHAKLFWRHLNELKRACTGREPACFYNAFQGPNCVDRTAELFEKAGIPAFQMLTDEDLTENGFNLEHRALGYAYARKAGIITAVSIGENIALAAVLLSVGWKLKNKIAAIGANAFSWVNSLFNLMHP